MTKTCLCFQVCISERSKGVLGVFIHLHQYLSKKDGKDTCMRTSTIIIISPPRLSLQYVAVNVKYIVMHNFYQKTNISF